MAEIESFQCLSQCVVKLKRQCVVLSQLERLVDSKIHLKYITYEVITAQLQVHMNCNVSFSAGGQTFINSFVTPGITDV